MNILLKLALLAHVIFWAAPVEASWEDVKDDVAAAAHITNIDVKELAAVGYLESSFRPTVRAHHGTATGLMQITKPTWNHLVATYGAEYDITMRTPRTDPTANAIMAASYLKEGREIMERRLGRKVTTLEVYLGHKFGPYRATDLLTANRKTPLVDFYPEAASRNRSVYYHANGQPKTIGDVVAMFSRRLNYAINSYGWRAVEALAVLKQKEFSLYVNAIAEGQEDCARKLPTMEEVLELAKSQIESDPSRIVFMLKSTKMDVVESYYYYLGYSGYFTTGRKWRGHLV